jgi:hypothetical protein
MIRIGVTGHVHLTDGTTGLVRVAIRAALAPYAGPDLIGVTCLARGADQIFAHAVLDAGGRIEVVLPAPDYRDKQISPGNRAVFDALLTRAASVRFTPYATSNRAAFMAAGEELLRSVERLLAVWDGGPSTGLGGTADVVAAARAMRLPVEVIWPAGARRATRAR